LLLTDSSVAWRCKAVVALVEMNPTVPKTRRDGEWTDGRTHGQLMKSTW